jgi:hypothetical protein
MSGVITPPRQGGDSDKPGAVTISPKQPARAISQIVWSGWVAIIGGHKRFPCRNRHASACGQLASWLIALPHSHITPESRTPSHSHSPQNSSFYPYPRPVESIMLMPRAEINRLTKQREKVPWLRFYKPLAEASGQRIIALDSGAVGLQKPRNRSRTGWVWVWEARQAHLRLLQSQK